MSGTTLKDKITNNSLFFSYKILKISDLYKLEVAKFMFQHHNNLLPDLFSNYFVAISRVHGYSTRGSANNNYYIPSITKSNAKSSLFYGGAKLWNSISTDIRLNPFSKFKENYYNYLINEYR